MDYNDWQALALLAIMAQKLSLGIRLGLFLLVFLYTASGSWRQAESADDTAKIYLPLIQRGSQAPVLKWQRGGCFSSWCETSWYSSPAVANIDSDPQLEVIAGMYDLVALDGKTGALQWRAESSNRV